MGWARDGTSHAYATRYGGIYAPQVIVDKGQKGGMGFDGDGTMLDERLVMMHSVLCDEGDQLLYIVAGESSSRESGAQSWQHEVARVRKRERAMIRERV
jgi:hypothetical protein